MATNHPQEAIWRKCLHPGGTFIPFIEKDVERSIPHRFEKQVARFPGRIAIKSRNYTLTYDALNKLANCIAGAILNHRESDKQTVALLFENDAPMIAAILGVLKAGEMYVPLDSSLPGERITYILEDSQAALMLTDSANFRLAHELARHQVKVINIDNLDSSLAADNVNVSVEPDTLAYVIYTSGSTGRPKGVVQNHRNVLHFVMRHTNAIHLCSDDRQTLLYSCSVNGAARDIFSALLNGASLLPLDIKKEGLARLAKWLIDEEITIYCSVSTVFRHFVPTLTGNEKFPKLRLIKLGGEPVYSSDVELYKKHFSSDCILCSGLGATETGTTVTQYFVDKNTPVIGNTVPLGYSVEDVKVLLLDEAGENIGLDRIGEIAIKSRYLSPGYWRRPDLTEAAFLPDTAEGNERIYRSGDLGRMRPDGCLDYMGRKDFQVKVRGHRIETAEVEIALLRLAVIKDAVVVVREDEVGHKRLVAYVVPTGLPAPNITKLRSVLAETLPHFMIPSAFVMLDTLPVAPNGKVDRQRLPAPDSARPHLERAYVAPRTPIEEKLSTISAQLLGIDKVGIDDNFFDLGGNSLLAGQLVSRLREAFDVELSLRSIFETSTVAELARRIEMAAHSGATVVPLARLQRDGNLPLSFSQQRLWFLDQLMPGSIAYNITRAARLTGPLNVAALEQSLTEVLRRHEILRTTLRAVNGQPFQSIALAKPFILPITDLEPVPEAERESEARRLATEEARRPFDLAKGPLFRSKLVRLGEDDHVLLLTMHHIVSDGWSMAILFRELSTLYEVYANGKPSPLAELPIQYVDYAVWQRNWLRGEVLETQLSYWKKQLENISTLNLPTDRPRPAVQSFNGAREALVLSTDLTQALKATSRKEGATLFMTLLAVFQILLHRLTGQDDIPVGSPIAGRNRSEIESLIGFFINTLVLRTDLSGNSTFTELLARVRRGCLDAYAHQDVPFEKLLEELRPERDPSRTPLFQVFFNMLNVAERAKLQGLKIETISAGRVESKFDLTIYVRERDGSLHFNWVYNSDLFHRDRIQEMSRQYEKLLSQIVEHPAVSIHSYSLLTAAAQELLPSPVEPLGSDWAGSVHDRFSLQARYLPDHPAITDPHESWTYEELNSRANQLAHYLLRSGIQREEIVAVYAHRSASLACALLGILKAGAAFLILDPTQPPARLLQYLGTAKPRGFIRVQAAGAVANNELEAVLEQTLDSQIALPALSELRREDFLAKYPTADPKVQIKPDDLAYVSFTSGSTGEPKGVLGRHGPLSQFLPWQAEKFALGPSDRFSLFSGLSHDPLHREIFTAFWVGAAVHVPEPDIIGAGGRLVGWMACQGITFAHLTPPLARLLSETAPPETELPLLRYAFLVGDKLTWTDVERLRRLSPNVTCVNSYGSTETQRAVSYHQISPQAKIGANGAIVPVGHGMPNVQLLILTREQKLAGLGEVGEIHMRSPHLARGYLADESLTEARFIMNPFTRKAGDRLYRTGDLGRYLADGGVEILGRIDGQVKIRGFRIELGEIEAVLMQHGAVRDCVVITREEVEETDSGAAVADGVAANPQFAIPNPTSKIENPKSNKRLVAYVVPKQNPAPPASELRRFLNARLPDYMVPSAFLFLNVLPLTPNGKLDHRNLPAPDQTRDRDEPFVAPRTPVEEMLAGIWAELLHVEPVGIHDNFFDLGGHSLLVTQVISRARRELQVDLPLRVLFESPTVSGLAERVEQVNRKGPTLSVRPMISVSRENDLPLSYAQQRLWFLDQYEPNSSVYNLPSALRVRGSLNIGVLEQSLNEIIRRHESLRTTFSMVDGEAVQVIAPSVGFSLAVVDLRDHPEGEREEEARRLVNEEAGRPFDLARGPLFRSKLVRLGEEDHVLLLTMHHIVSDGWSMGVLYRELSVLHQAFLNGQPSPLPELPIQYADFAVWQRECLKGEILDRQLSYWKKQLEGIPGVLNLPTDRPPPTVQSHRGARQSFVLSKELTEQLKALSHKEGVTLFMTLLAAFKALLYQYTGQTNLVIGTPIAGRNRPETEGLIGFFVNTLVLRSDLSGNPRFRELLRQVRDVCLGAYTHQELPYQKLVEALHPKRGATRISLARVSFAFQNVPRQPLKIPGLTVTPVRTDLGNAKGALTLFIWEADECLAGSLNYAVDLFNPATINQMIGHFQTLLTAVVADPEQRLLDLPGFLKPSRSELLEAIHWASEQSWHFESGATVGRDQGEL
jgi:amino acid adenylation domain-containing protein